MLNTGILSGVKVLGLEQQVAGPFCTMMLSDQGAEVIKVERPGSGDTAREMGPFMENDKGEKQSGYFTRFNRNKKSVTVNMRSAEGQEVLRDLIKNADIVVENLKPGLMDKIGFSCEEIKKINPGVVYVAISGFGRSPKHEGPFSKRLAYDIVAQGMSGMMHACGNDTDGPPTWLGLAVGDTGTGVYASYAAMLGYVNKLRTGKGEFIDVSMYDCMIAMAERTHNIYSFSDKVIGRGPDPLVAPWGAFKAKDGYVAIVVPTEAMWKKFVTAIERVDLLDNPDLQSGPGRAANMDMIMPIILDWMKDKTKNEVTELIMAQGLPCGPIQTAEDVAKCPHIAKRELLVKIPSRVVGEVTVVGSPLKMQENDPQYRDVPSLGADNDEIMAELGYDEKKIQGLKDNKII
jgi:crotonobetainyl-CoA:carnitine CoA-transferase CaiB-like acyl-CoA transferase